MYGWNESGGGTIFPKEVTKELVRKGYEIYVIFASLRSDPLLPPYSVERGTDDGVQLFGIYNRPAIFIDPDHPEREIKDSSLVRIFNLLLDEIKPDIVHFNNFHGLTFSIAEEVKKKGIPSCYTPHNYHMIDPNLYLFNNDLSLWKGVNLIDNSESVKRNNSKKSLYVKRAETARKLLNNWVDVTLAVSSRQKELLTEFGAKENKITVVHQSNKSADLLWLDSKLAKENSRALKLPLKVGFIGGVMPQKGVHMLAAAAQAFDKTDAEFHIYGFVFPAYLDQLRKIDIRGNLIFHGEYKQEQLTMIASQIDIAVVPSVWEDCAPLVVLELHAMRLPVIAAKIGGIPDFIDEGVNGFLYEYNSVDKLKDKIRFCVNNTDIVSTMRQKLIPVHSFNKYINHLEYIYDKLLKSSWHINELELNISAHNKDNKTIDVVWEGSQYVNHSLAYINRELCMRLIKEGLNLSVIPYEPDSFQPAPNSPMCKIRELYYRQQKNTDIHVRHQWPPNLTAPEKGHWVIIQPWEFGSLPKSWVGVFSTLVDEMWVPGNYVRQLYIDAGIPEDRVFVVPNGYNPDRFNPGVKPFKLKTKKKFKFLFVGGTIYRKGIDLLLDAYIQAFKKSDNVCLVVKDMGGDSFYKGQTYKERISGLVRQNDAPEIEYIDYMLSEKELAGIYTACDILVHPYRGEGFGLPILEAMASGIPAIVTNGGACLDFCSEENSLLVNASKFFIKEKKIGDMETADYPWLFEPSLEDLKQKMVFSFQNQDEIKILGKKAQQFVSDNFSWDCSFKVLRHRIEKLKDIPVIRFNSGNNIMPEPAPVTFNKLFSEAGISYKEGNSKQALETILRAGNLFNPAETNISPEEIYILTGNICLSLDDIESARTAFESALKEKPQSSEACLGLAAIFYRSGMLNEAKIMLGWSIKYNPGNEIAAKMLMEITNAAGTGDNISNNVSDSAFITHFNAAYKLVSEGDYRAALLKLNEAESAFSAGHNDSNITPEDVNILKGSIFMSLGENDNARLSFEKALQTNPSSAGACLGLGKIFYKTNMYEASKTMFEWAVKNDPDNNSAKENLREINILLKYPESHNNLTDKTAEITEEEIITDVIIGE